MWEISQLDEEPLPSKEGLYFMEMFGKKTKAVNLCTPCCLTVNNTGLEGSSKGMKFLHPSRMGVRPTQLPVQRVIRLLTGDKAPGLDVNHPPPSRV
jgi:hypothetical protein